MATITRDLSTKVNISGKSEIHLRINITRTYRPRIKSGIFINPNRFKSGKIIIPRANQIEIAELRSIENALIDLERHLQALCDNTPVAQLTSDYLNQAIHIYHHPEQYNTDNTSTISFFDLYHKFIASKKLSLYRIHNYEVLERALQRFEKYRSVSSGKMYKLNIDSFGIDDVNAFETFLRTEHQIYNHFPSLYEDLTQDEKQKRQSPKPKPRGDNTIVTDFKALRAFFNWCNIQGFTSNRPFDKYTGIRSQTYGTPYYITIEERDLIANFDLSYNKSIETQRDIFIFQCFIGCRVSDLMRLTPANIIHGAVEYIATKTKGERPEVIRVPLHHRALELIEKYTGSNELHGKLLPFISPQKYNDAIKRIFTICGITRMVTVLNPTTGQEEQRPLNEIASSHLARRTFVGNLYRQVKDPNLVGKLSGHAEGSKAFARYRDIDEEIKKDLINLLGD